MPDTRTLLSGPISVVEYRCAAGAERRPVAEQHRAWSVSYVQRGSFGCRCRGTSVELVPGAVLLGRPGDDFTCTHEHHLGGDECLAIFLAPAVVDEIALGRPWASGALPPLPELMVLGELARAAINGEADVGLDEAALALAARQVAVAGGRGRGPQRLTGKDRRRAVESALLIESRAAEPVDLAMLAAEAGLSPYHYLRLFSAALGVTPHQYLLRCRLRHAARLLASGPQRTITEIALDAGFADLSNFVRTFGRAAGVSPGRFRQRLAGRRA